MDLCLFCGTFNPVHNAHLRAADYALANFGFKKIIFIPTNVAPHKNVSGCTAQDRLNMVRLAVQNNPNFEVSAIEFQSNEKSYTYNTVIKLNDIYNNSEKWPFIIGTDAFKQIESWYRADELKNLLDFIVLAREVDINDAKFEELRNKGFDFKFTNLDFCDISSTEIRNNVQAGIDISNLVNEEVKNYIYEHGIYR